MKRWTVLGAVALTTQVGIDAPHDVSSQGRDLAEAVEGMFPPGPVLIALRSYGMLPDWFDAEALEAELLERLPAGSAITPDAAAVMDRTDAGSRRAGIAATGITSLVSIELYPAAERVDVAVSGWSFQPTEVAVEARVISLEAGSEPEPEPVPDAPPEPEPELWIPTTPPVLPVVASKTAPRSRSRMTVSARGVAGSYSYAQVPESSDGPLPDDVVVLEAPAGGGQVNATAWGRSRLRSVGLDVDATALRYTVAGLASLGTDSDFAFQDVLFTGSASARWRLEFGLGDGEASAWLGLGIHQYDMLTFLEGYGTLEYGQLSLRGLATSCGFDYASGGRLGLSLRAMGSLRTSGWVYRDVQLDLRSALSERLALSLGLRAWSGGVDLLVEPDNVRVGRIADAGVWAGGGLAVSF